MSTGILQYNRRWKYPKWYWWNMGKEFPVASECRIEKWYVNEDIFDIYPFINFNCTSRSFTGVQMWQYNNLGQTMITFISKCLVYCNLKGLGRILTKIQLFNLLWFYDFKKLTFQMIFAREWFKTIDYLILKMIKITSTWFCKCL